MNALLESSHDYIVIKKKVFSLLLFSSFFSFFHLDKEETREGGEARRWE